MTELNPEQKIHRGWHEYEDKIKGKIDIAPMFEKYQYIYTQGENKISLVQFTKRIFEHPWEIYQINGKETLLEDVERFPSKEEAEIRIKELFKID